MRTFILAVTGLVISVTACSSYGTSVVEVQKNQPHVASVSVSLPRSLAPGNTARATATIKDANGAILMDRTVAWYSSSGSVATVTDSGTVSAVAPGDAVVSAVSDGISGQAAVSVIAPPPTPTPVVTVVVAINPGSVVIGQTAHATATPLDANGNPLSGRAVTWQSSNVSIASVAATGDVSAKGLGTASISASTEGKTGVAALTVNVPPPVPVATISVTPTTATLQIGGNVQFTAVTRDANNNILTGRVITWSSINASIATVSALGLVTAIASGTTQITASSEGTTASAAISVSVVVAPVASVSVSLGNNSLTAGETTQATATTRDANNNLLTGRAISWSSSNTAVATVSASSGLVTAVAAGSSQISATSEGKSGNATLTVVAAPPPPPPPPGGSVEPSGMTVLTERPFSAVTEDGWTVAPWSGSNANCEIITDAAAPKSPSNIGRIKYPAGFASGGEPCGMTKVLNTYRTMYLSFWFKVSSNWVGHPTGANKILHINIGGSNHFVVNLWGYGNGMMQMGILLQGIVNDGAGATSANWLPNLGPTGEVVRAQWYHVEVLAVGNTSGAANGSVDWWLNGVKVGSHSNVQYVSGNGVWEQISWAPTWGGAGPSVSSEMDQYIDHLYISGK